MFLLRMFLWMWRRRTISERESHPSFGDKNATKRSKGPLFFEKDGERKSKGLIANSSRGEFI